MLAILSVLLHGEQASQLDVHVDGEVFVPGYREHFVRLPDLAVNWDNINVISDRLDIYLHSSHVFRGHHNQLGRDEYFVFKQGPRLTDSGRPGHCHHAASRH